MPLYLFTEPPKPTNWLTPWMSYYSHWSVVIASLFYILFWIILDECRTLWGEPLQAVCLHVIIRCMRWHKLHVSLIGEKVGDNGSNTSSNRIGCLFIALYKTCLLTRRSAHIVAVVGRLSGLWPSCDQCQLCRVCVTSHEEQRAQLTVAVVGRLSGL